MHIKCDKELLVENINLVQKAVSSKTSMPILECFLLSCDNEGFKMVSTDLEIGIKTEAIQCEVLQEGAVALPSRFFSEIIKKLPDGVVSIKTEDSYVTIIKCQSSEFKIIGRNPEEFPELPQVEREKDLLLNQGVLKSLIRQTSFSICQDDSKPNLQGALLEISGGVINMVTCDTFRVSFSKGEISSEASQAEERVIVPSKTINEMLKLLVNDDENLTIYMTKKHILFDIGSCIVVSRLIEGDFINYANIFPEEFETRITVDREIFTDALERASLVSFYENKKNPVRMKMENNCLLVSTAAETGNAFDEIEIDLSGKDIEIAFNPRFLLDAVKSMDSELVSISFNSPLSPCVVKAAEECDYKFLILPLRLKS